MPPVIPPDSALSKLRRVAKQAGIKKHTTSKLTSWLEKEDAYTLHRPVRNHFPRNPYTANNVMDVWECDQIDVQLISRYINNIKFLLMAIFSNFLHIVPLRSKTGKDVTAAFRNIFKDPKYSYPVRRRPIIVRTDKGKEFLNTTFQDVLKQEGVEFSVCRNPDVKYAVIERANHPLRDTLYKYFIYNNTHRYIDVPQEFVTGYNQTVHTATGMAPAQVSGKDVLAIWRRMNKKARRVRSVKAKYGAGQLVRISKAKVRFAKSAEQNYTTEIFRIIKVIP
jgi:hypothetical protein